MIRILIALVLVAAAPAASACSVCVTSPLKFAFQDSQYFFVGKVIHQEQWSVTFAVAEQFKGAPVEQVTLQTSNSCSISAFTLGGSYLVEATADGPRLFAYLCSHTGSLDDPLTQRKLELVRRRATWWRSAPGRISLRRFLQWVGQRPG
jgi:hypothetical protein